MKSNYANSQNMVKYIGRKRIVQSVLCVIVMCVCVSSFAQSAMFSKQVNLKTGDSLILSPNYPTYPKEAHKKEMAIADKCADEILSSGLLKAFDVDKYGTGIREIIRYNCDKLYIYDGVDGLCINVYAGVESKNFDWDGYDGFLHKIIRVKAIRGFGYKVLTKLLVDFSSYYPKDFKNELIATLKDVSCFIDDMKHHKYTVVKGTYDGRECCPEIHIDGKESDNSSYLKGFILRRIFLDEVPAEEIKKFVSSLSAKLKATNTKNNYDIFYKVTINDEIDYCYTAVGSYFYSKKTKQKVYSCEDLYNRIHSAQRVVAIKDADKTYYKIYNGWYNYWEKGWHYFSKYDEDYKYMLMDSAGQILFKEKN